jgi:hypothetical protein
MVKKKSDQNALHSQWYHHKYLQLAALSTTQTSLPIIIVRAFAAAAMLHIWWMQQE